MTASTVSHHSTNHTLWPAERVHLPAFALALVLAPLWVTLLTFVFVVPVFALLFGALPYLAVGGPLLFWLASRRPITPADTAWYAFAANVALLALSAAAAAILGDEELFGLSVFIFGFGCIFAPLWGLAFGWLYRLFTRKDSGKEKLC